MLNVDSREYPFPEHYHQIGGMRFHYVDEGQGHPIVMLHGNPSWSFYYRNLVKSLCGQYRTIAPDHVGCGKSEKPQKRDYPFSYRRRVDDVEDFVDELGLEEPLTLILHDWGGMIGMAYACRYPERIRRIVITNTTAFRLPKTKRFPWQLAIARNPVVGRFLVQGLNGFALPAAYLGVRRQAMPKSVRKSFLAPYDSWQSREAIYRFVEDIPLAPSDGSFSELEFVEENLVKLQNIPLLAVWGKQDPVFDEHFYREWQRRFPKGEFHLFDDAGHYVLEDAQEEAAALIKDFLVRR